MNMVTVLIPIVTATVTAIWAMYQYFSARSADRRRNDFEAFHRMVGSLPQGGTHTISPESALATIYELRNYPAYFPVTQRMLEMYRTRMPSDDEFAVMQWEIEDTLKYIRAHSNAA